ncbi:MAG: hypothetical protein HC780_12625 [Leptolyngbyaceae cyanobacterium CSU_1_3]|nr:hypothetical protein [Leptolyngbyaceae cyanobacterium CSU_1_3]
MSDPTSQKLAISRAEIRAIHSQGKDAVIALVGELWRRIRGEHISIAGRMI